MTAAPTFQAQDELNAERLEALLPDLVRQALPGYVGSQRWFGDKARILTRTEPSAHALVVRPDAIFVLLIVDVAFAEGAPVEYFVPLTVSRPGDVDPLPIAWIEAPCARWVVQDAIQTRMFRDWLLEELVRRETASSGRFRWTATTASNELLLSARDAGSRVSTAQQSNSSIVYGNSVILKAFRRLSPGINPEVEIGRFLTTSTGFRNTPRLLGEWTYVGGDGVVSSLGVAQSFIPSVGDGWGYTLDALRSPANASDAEARRLGELTAQMHLTLESARGDPDLTPEPIQPEDATAWVAGVARAVTTTARALEVTSDHRIGETRDLIDAFLNLAPRLTAQASGFELLVGATKTRVHGDYHLGQTLRTTDGDFVILDFEGEPQRPIHERRAKTSPLKDVAGMLRSFGYARGAAERQAHERGEPLDSLRSALVAWERSARRAFIDGYVAESRRGGARYLPTSDDDIRQALAAWELDKALYEVNYELNNRPDWLALPLAATLKLA
ncbi:MAG: maltose alpha-D-glucosyltransferase / alpha-amylase [Thermomicrobiales bacterium]|nr:maltose alpha-D-glucosyltransferase / alpha-amylase [Thermomicrobiales bacterium]